MTLHHRVSPLSLLVSLVGCRGWEYRKEGSLVYPPHHPLLTLPLTPTVLTVALLSQGNDFLWGTHLQLWSCPHRAPGHLQKGPLCIRAWDASQSHPWLFLQAAPVSCGQPTLGRSCRSGQRWRRTGCHRAGLLWDGIGISNPISVTCRISAHPPGLSRNPWLCAAFQMWLRKQPQDMEFGNG